MSQRPENGNGELLGIRGLDIERIGAVAGRQAIAYFSDPENLAGLSGSVLLLLAVFRGRGPRLIPALIVSGMGQAGGRMAYRSYKNLELLAQAASGPASLEGS